MAHASFNASSTSGRLMALSTSASVCSDGSWFTCGRSQPPRVVRHCNAPTPYTYLDKNGAQRLRQQNVKPGQGEEAFLWGVCRMRATRNGVVTATSGAPTLIHTARPLHVASVRQHR